MLKPIPGYLQSTASRMIKELPPDNEEITLFMKKQKEIQRRSGNGQSLRTNLNPKVDMVELVINSRAQRLEKFLSSNAMKKTKAEGSNTQRGSTQDSKFLQTISRYEKQG